ncbi:hypothetical protein [Vreelandella salicampi]|uniref:Uncharacterized protein n=1 Tax=Vreelandella salicampi TaxID=1449798 RepID=A0A7Z0LPC2_9GAMM|nr:hypothetical protein [Halomonas salicampi]NYS62599.1 hypothetical protein [Halomonas salicampi]
MNVATSTIEAPSILQPRLPDYPYSEIYSESHHTLLHWHIQLHTVWRNPLQLNHWPSDEPYNSGRGHWANVALHEEADIADMLLDMDDPEMVGLSELGNLMMVSRHAAKYLVQEHGIPYEETTRRTHRAFDIPLAPALLCLMTLPGVKSITRNRATWGWLAIAAGLWKPETGYLLSPEDVCTYEYRMRRRLVDRSWLQGKGLEEATEHNKRKTQTEAYQRFRNQQKLAKRLQALGRYAPQDAVCIPWDDASREGW